MRWLGASLAVLLLTTTLVAQQAMFRSSVDAVAVDVSVRDRSRVVSGLTANDFVILDNGVQQTVTDVSFGAVPIDLTVALDVSQSVNGRQLQSLRTAVGQLMSDVTKNDRVRLFLFNELVRREVDFTSKASDLDTALARAIGKGATSVIDALSLAMVTADEPERRQLVMFFTDGADTTSITPPRTLLDLARHTNATVSAVIPDAGPLGRLGAPIGQSDYLKVFRSLAAETGGVVTTQDRGQDLTTTFRRTLDEFRMSYVLRFTPSGARAPGFHALQVSIAGRGGLTVRARRGYSAGDDVKK